MDSLLRIYRELKEGAGSADDFPYVLGNYQHKMLVSAFKGVNTTWPLWCWRTTVEDFKANYRNIVGELQDLVQKPYPGGHSEDSKQREDKWTVAVVEWGKDYSIGREVIINDDLNAFGDIPTKLGRAAARTIANHMAVTILEANPNAYDAVTLFHATSHAGIANTVATALTLDATGLGVLETGFNAIMKATDEEANKLGIVPKYLLVPIDLQHIATGFYQNDTVGTGTGQTTNRMKGKLQPLVEPFLSSATQWYIVCDPADIPCLEVAFLNGKDVPDLMVKKPEYSNLAGGDDPFGYEFGDMNYRARYDFGAAVGYYQGMYRGGTG